MDQSTVTNSTARAGKVLRLLRYAWPYRMGWIVVAGASLGVTVLSLAQPWPMKVLVDNVIGTQQAGGIVGQLPGAGNKLALAGWVALSVVLIYAFNALIEA